MLRPLILDIFALLIPIGLGALLFCTGRSLFRLPKILQGILILLAVTIVLGGAASLARLLPDEVAQWVSRLGGNTAFLSWVALFLLGIAWTAPNRRMSTAFLGCLVGLAGCLLLIEGSGSLWWRFCAPFMWQNSPSENGGMRQTSALTCSPTAAAILLHHYGIPASEGEMAYLAGTSLFGSDAPAMARALNAKIRPLGYEAHADHTTYEECLQRGRPFIAHVKGQNTGHALLVFGIADDVVQIFDPALGEAGEFARADFERIWDGTTIWIDRAKH